MFVLQIAAIIFLYIALCIALIVLVERYLS